MAAASFAADIAQALAVARRTMAAGSDVAASVEKAVYGNNVLMLTHINYSIPLTAAHVPQDLIAAAIKYRKMDALRWLSEHGLVTAADLDGEWHRILDMTLDAVRWARSLGSRPVGWNLMILDGVFIYDRRRKHRPSADSAEILDWAAEDPSFVQCIQRHYFGRLCSLLLHRHVRQPDAIRAAARHFDIVPHLVRYAVNRRNSMPRLTFLLDSGVISRASCLANQGALLCIVRDKKKMLSAFVRKFALTRSDFAAVGMSTVFSADL